MTSATVVNAADDFSRHVKAAMMFDNGQTEGHTGGPENDIRMLHELAKKLMELAEKAGGEIDEERCKSLDKKTNHPRVATVDADRKDVAIVLA